MRRRRFDALAMQNPWQKSQASKCRIPLQSPLSSTFQPENRPLDFTKTRNLYKCNSQRTIGMSVFYTSTAGFKGSDMFEVEVFYTSFATSRKVRFRVMVK
jgi:hypothetical protein